MSLWARPRPRRRAGSAACTRKCSWSARTAAAASTAGAGIAARTTRITTPMHAHRGGHGARIWRGSRHHWLANRHEILHWRPGCFCRNARRNSANACARNLAISTRSTRPGISTCSASGTTILPISPPRATLGTTRISCSPGARSRMIRTSPFVHRQAGNFAPLCARARGHGYHAL